MKKIFLILTISVLFINAFSNKALNTEQKIPSGCSVITISRGDKVFFGGNYDYVNPDSWYFVEQGDSLSYGVIWIGLPDNPQQGVNEKCQAYDANGLPRSDVNPHTERLPCHHGS